MARTLRTTRYPLLKVLVPLALILLAIGVVLFFTAKDADGNLTLNPIVLLPWLVAAAVLAFASLLWRKKEEVQVLLPSDRLHDASRQDLQGILETLERQKEKGEITPERYAKARDRVLSEMKAGK